MGIMMDGTNETTRINALLHSAAANCSKDTILKILQRGADIMAGDSNHRLPLEAAIANKNSKYIFLQSHYFSPMGQSHRRGQGSQESTLFSLINPLKTAKFKQKMFVHIWIKGALKETVSRDF
jgi:ankyrin repeat protein